MPRAIAALRPSTGRLTVVVCARGHAKDTLQQAAGAGAIDLTSGRLVADGGRCGLDHERLHLEPIRLVARAGSVLGGIKANSLAELIAYPWIVPVRDDRIAGPARAVFFHEGLPLPYLTPSSAPEMLTLRPRLLAT